MADEIPPIVLTSSENEDHHLHLVADGDVILSLIETPTADDSEKTEPSVYSFTTASGKTWEAVSPAGFKTVSKYHPTSAGHLSPNWKPKVVTPALTSEEHMESLRKQLLEMLGTQAGQGRGDLLFARYGLKLSNTCKSDEEFAAAEECFLDIQNFWEQCKSVAGLTHSSDDEPEEGPQPTPFEQTLEEWEARESSDHDLDAEESTREQRMLELKEELMERVKTAEGRQATEELLQTFRDELYNSCGDEGDIALVDRYLQEIELFWETCKFVKDGRPSKKTIG
jgi:hypothetical protein